MKPFFCRIGSKAKIANKLLKLFPKHSIYVEPFIGSGALLYAKQPSDVEVINDLDKNVINNFKMLKNADINIENYNLRTTLEAMNKLVNSKPINKTDKLLKELYMSCNTFSSTGKGKIYKQSSGIQKISKIRDYKNRLKDVKIENKDYEYIIKNYDSKNTFFFLDPPYENSENLYDEGSFDFENLRDVVSKIKGLFMITLNDSKYIRTIFKDFIIKEMIVKGFGTKGIGTKDRKELIIMNYELSNF
jgi:DNA adenine methylase